MSSVNRVARIGAVFFALWGVLHVLAAVGGVVSYAQSGAIGVLSLYSGATVSTQANQILNLAGAIGLNYSIDLAGFGLLAAWMASQIWRGERRGFWLNAIVLGIADAAFIYALVLSGFVSIADGFIGPLLYVLGVVFTTAGFYGVQATFTAHESRASRS